MSSQQRGSGCANIRSIFGQNLTVHSTSDDGKQTGRSAGGVGVASDQYGNGAIGGGVPIKANILIVDDKPENLLALAQMLGSLNENIAQPKSGADALPYLFPQDAATLPLNFPL